VNDALKVECPFCYAPAGKPCIRKGRIWSERKELPQGKVHNRRIRMAAKESLK
jgi:hypothetical protein